MAITRVQYKRGTSTTNIITVTMDSTPIDGNVLVAVIGTAYNGTKIPIVSSISQTGVTWTKQVSKSTSTRSNSETWLGVVGAGASATITINLNATASNGAIANVCEYSGIAVNPLDKTATNIGTSRYPDTGTTDETTLADELWIGNTSSWLNDQTDPTNGFTLIDGVKYYPNFSVAYLEKIVSATGTANSGTTTVGSNQWVGCIATFKASAGGEAHYKTVSEILGLVDSKTYVHGHYKTSSEILGLVDGYDKNRCKKCKPSSVTLTF